MKKSKILKRTLPLLFFFLALNNFSYSQYGPAGVGNNNGDDGQPANLFWFRADSLNLNDNDPVDTWYDLSGNERNFSQSNSSYRPVFRNADVTINGHPVVMFDGTDDFLEDIDADEYLDGISGFTLISVIQSNTIDTDAGFFDTEDPDGQDDLLCIRYDASGIDGSGNDVIKTGINTTDGSVSMESSSDIQTTDKQMLTLDWISGNELRLFENGDEDTPTDGSGSLNGTITGTQKGMIGKGPKDASSAWDGAIAEIIMYDVRLNTAQRNIVENYLGEKYDITIANDYLTGNGDFNDNIAGIGKESDGSNDRANSAGFIISQNGGFDNGDYVMFAHDNSPNNTVNQDSEVTNSGAEAAWNREWYVENTDPGDNLDVKISFDIPEGFEGGQYPREEKNYRLLYRTDPANDYDTINVSGKGIENTDQVYFLVDAIDFESGYYTFGTVDQSESPVEGTEGRTWYTLVSGNWEDWETWTLDPAGALPDNPDKEIPSKVSDNVVILSGNTVTVNSDSLENATIEVSGRLDLQETKGHSFSEISGGGKILMADDNFPDGDATDFNTPGRGEGSVKYYGNDDTVSVSREFYNMEVEMSSSSDTLTVLADYTINNNLLLNRGNLKINGENSTTPLHIKVDGDLTVSQNASMSVGKADAFDSDAASGYGNYHKGFHILEIGGDFQNEGVVRFTNQDKPDYENRTTEGAVSLKFSGASNNKFEIYNTTDLYNLVVNKGEGRTYKLELYSDDVSYFALYGQNNDDWNNGSTEEENANPENRKALWIKDGTLELKGNIYIPSLSEGGLRDFTIGNDAALILNGSNVRVDITADGSTDFSSLSHDRPDGINTGTGWQGIYVMGKLQLDAGTLIQRSGEAINFRDEAPGNLVINGGNLTANQIAISSAASAGTYAFTQTGGTINLTGEHNPDGNRALLHLDNSNMIFNVSGGSVHIQGTSGNEPNAVHIGSDEGNYNVSGGTLYFENNTVSEVQSTAPFYNVEIEDGSELLLLEPFKALGNVIINSNATFNTDGYDLTIGRNFTLDESGSYLHNDNTTHFTGSQSGNIYVGNSSTLQFYNLELDKDQRWNPALYHSLAVHSYGANDPPVEILNDLTVNRGEIDVNDLNVDVRGDIEIVDGGLIATDDPPGHIVLNGSNTQTLKGSYSGTQHFGTLELDNGNGALLESDIQVDDFILTQGVMNLDVYNLDVAGTIIDSTASGFDDSNMFQTAGNASDGSLTLTINFSEGSDGTEYLFPFGTNTGYTPATLTQTADVNDTGKYSIKPVNSYHPATTDSSRTIPYYWVVEMDGYDNIQDADVQYSFYYPGTIPNNQNKGALLWDGDDDWYTYDGIVNGNDLDFPSGAYLTGDYTVGNQSVFNPLTIYYSRGDQGFKNWTDTDTWSTEGHDGDPAGSLPEPYDIVQIGYDSTAGDNAYHWVVMDNNNTEVAEVRFAGDGSTWNPRLYVQPGHTQNINKLSGRGDLILRVEPSDIPAINGDLGDFLSGEYNRVGYHIMADGHVDIPENIAVYPNLRIEAQAAAIGNRSLSFESDILIKQNLTVDGNSSLILNDGTYGDIMVNGNTYIGNWYAGRILFPSTGTNRNLTVFGDFQISDQEHNSSANDFRVLNNNPSGLEHNFILGGDLIQDAGNIDLFTDNSGGNNVITTITGETNHEFTNNSGDVPDFYRIVMNKQEGNDFTFDDNFNLLGPTDSYPKALELISGRLRLRHTDIDVNLSSGGQDFRIPSEATLHTSMGASVNVTGDNTGIKLDGSIHAGYDSEWNINGGTNNYIEYTSSGNAEIDIFQANFYVGSQIRRALATEAGIIEFRQNHANSEVIIGTNAHEGGESSRGILELTNDSYFKQVTGAKLTIANAVENAAIPSFYLDLDDSRVDIENASTISFGSSHTANNQDMGLYSTVNMKNIEVVNTGGEPSVTMKTLPLTADTLSVESGGVFNANGLDLTLLGDMECYGMFNAGGNNTYFSGTVNQEIFGNPEFYNLYKTENNTLLINDEIQVSNDLYLESGELDDGGNTISVKGDIVNDALHLWGGTGDGILMNGSQKQEMFGNGTYGKLSLNNSEGVVIPEVGNNVYIDDALQLEKGVFDIGKNLLELDENAEIIEESAFSEDNMVQTNISFTDAGVRKYFPALSSETTFIYPIGSGGKYTPVELIIRENDQTGFIRVKAANERHPSIVEDDEDPDCELTDSLNVLQYHWLVEAQDITYMEADMNMYNEEEDVWFDNSCGYTDADYITAKLLREVTLWEKYSPTSFDEGANKLQFNLDGTDAKGISGDYTAGIDGSAFNGAIPDSVPVYHSAQNGNWRDNSTWEEDVAGGPKGSVVYIDDTVTVTKNYLSSYRTILEPTGVLRLESTFGHRLGLVSGQGTLSSWRGDLPAGDYEEFFSSEGGTLEYAGANNLDILSGIPSLNNLRFANTGVRRFPNQDITLYGNLEIMGDDNTLEVINDNNRTFRVQGNITFDEGTFEAGTGEDAKIILNGDSVQSVFGSFEGTDALNYVELNNSAGVEIFDSVEVDQVLTLTDGMVYLPDTALLTLKSTNNNALSGATSDKYIQGPLRKRISNGDSYTFEIGDTSRYGILEIPETEPTSASYWEAQYYNNNPGDFGYDTSNYASPLQSISGNEFWRVKGPGGQSHVKIRWDDESVLPAETDDRENNLHIAQWMSGSSEWESVGDDVIDNGVNDGTIQTNNKINLEEHVFTLASEESVPKPTASFTTTDTAVCEEGIIEMEIELTGDPDWTIEIYKDGSSYDTFTASSSPHTITISSSADLADDGTYSIESVEDNNTVGNVYGDPVEVTVNQLPQQFNLEGGGTICSNDSTELTLDDSEMDVDYELYRDGELVASVEGTNDAISFGYFSTAGSYTAEGIDISTGCRETMTGTEEVTVETAPELDSYTDMDTVCYDTGIDIPLYANDVNGVGNDFIWTPVDSLDNASAENPNYQPSANPDTVSVTTMFYVTATETSSGCQDTDSVEVTLFRKPQTGNQYYVPNDFDQD